jgi:hypothetical protein
MKYKLLLTLVVLGSLSSQSQVIESYVHQGEIGLSIGGGHYFGDLNPDINFSKPKLSAALHFTKQFSNYVGIKASATYAQLGYSDIYSNNPQQKVRNLSFNSDVWEFSLNGTFNFFKFIPSFEEYRYTPYIALGIGVFSYDPYAFLGGQKYMLRTLGTEGQGSTLYPNLKPYSNIAYCVPFTVGFKYALSRNFNVFTEFRYRFTTTDYLDDVSGAYAPDAFPVDPITGIPSVGFLLQDRSYEYGTSIGIKGRQRGNSSIKDAFATFHIGISFNLQSYKCPSY